MFWIYALFLLAAMLGWAGWYDRRKKIRRVNAPERLLGMGDMNATSTHQVDRTTRPQDRETR